jgi:hypothetical protein
LLCIWGAGLALAQAPGDPDAPAPGEVITGIVSVEGAYLYVGPDFAYRIVGQLSVNESVTVTGRRGDFFFAWDGRQWLQIDYGGQPLWVYARLVRTSVPFNSIPPRGIALPRNRDGRVPAAFDLSQDICNTWGNEFSQSTQAITDSDSITVTFSPMPGATLYQVIVLSPSGARTAFDSTDPIVTFRGDQIRSRREYGTYTWRVAPYWTNSTNRRSWQQICLLRTGGTFERLP